MISTISPVLASFVSSSKSTRPLKRTLRYKFNARLQESHNNLSNFIKDSMYPEKMLRK